MSSFAPNRRFPIPEGYWFCQRGYWHPFRVIGRIHSLLAMQAANAAALQGALGAVLLSCRREIAA